MSFQKVLAVGIAQSINVLRIVIGGMGCCLLEAIILVLEGAFRLSGPLLGVIGERHGRGVGAGSWYESELECSEGRVRREDPRRCLNERGKE